MFSEQEPKGITDCMEKSKAMQVEYRERPDVQAEGGRGRRACGMIVISKPLGKGGTQVSSFHRKGESVDSSYGIEDTVPPGIARGRDRL